MINVKNFILTPSIVNAGDSFKVEVDVESYPLTFNELDLLSFNQLDTMQWNQVDDDEFIVGSQTANITVSNDVIMKSSGVTGWDAEVKSELRLTNRCYVEFEAINSTKYLMFGLNTADTTNSYSDIDFSIYLRGGTVYVYENGSSRGSFRTYTAGDRFKIVANIDTVYYYMNDELFYTSTIAPPSSLIVDSSFYHVSAGVKNVRFGLLPYPTRIRYIRDWLGPSDSSNSHIWCEIKANESNGTNVALNKLVIPDINAPYSVRTPDYVTDGHTGTTYYFNSIVDTEIHNVVVDLGQPYLLDNLQIWHYPDNSRTFFNTKTEVSYDGIEWFTVFDSAISGTYKETSAGHTINL
jgi:hypothetical protein